VIRRVTPGTMVADFITALRFARRDLRGGFHGFRVMLTCLALGVAAIAGIGSLTAAVRDGLARDARTLLGGDLDIRITSRSASAEQLAWFRGQAHVSAMARMRAMAARGDGHTIAGRKRALIELKAVDQFYPLLGKVILSPEMALDKALARANDGRFGTVVEAGLLSRLGLKIGDSIRIGLAQFDIRAVLRDEPDKASGAFKLGPRVLIADAALPGTGLVQPGSLIRWHYRLQYPPGTDGVALEKAIDTAFPDMPWRVRNVHEATPRIQRHVNRAALFFTLVGLITLLVGGIGVAGAVKGHLDNKRDTIATLKCLGATGRIIITVYALEIALMAAVGIGLGLTLGGVLPLALVPMLAPYLPVTPGFSVHLPALATAAAYGIAIACLFTLWPLARAQAVPAAALFRGLITAPPFRPRIGMICSLALAGGAVVGLALMTSFRPSFAGWFIFGAVLAFAVFTLVGRSVGGLARMMTQRISAQGAAGRHRPRPRLQLALANIARPGAPTGAIVLALGIGLTVFVALAQIEGNFQRQIADRLPDSAPAYFFIDIQPDQVAAFEAAIRAVPGAGEINRLPSLRGRIAKVNGKPISDITVGPSARWAVESDRGVTYTGPMPEGTTLVKGFWWPDNYTGPPLLSIDARIARGLGVGVGDMITLNVLGRELTAQIKNTRKIDWAQLGLNFTMIFAPGLLEKAPQTFIATVKASRAAEEPLARAVIDRFGNITAIRVREALEAVAEALGKIGLAARATAGLALVSGILVLAGAIAAGRRERTRDAVILKVTGTRRRDLALAYVIEYGIAAIAAALTASILGTITAFLVLTRVMDADWVFLPGPAMAALIGTCLAVIGFGFAGTWRGLAQSPAQVLRDTART
jgi:putative ABC transport system permease protein